MLTPLANLFRDAADLLFPRICVLCGADATSPVCGPCQLDLVELTTEPACEDCGKPLASEVEPCPWCEGRGMSHLDGVLRWGSYEGAIQHLVHLMKFESRPDVAIWMGERLGRQALESGWAERIDAVAAVPLHRRRELVRGYDQAGLIASGLAKALGRPTVRPLLRDRATPPQSSLNSVGARRANVRDAFVLIDEPSVAGRRLLLVDDVLTTGATLRNAARRLRDARPGAIHAAVVAVADPRRRQFGEV